MEGKIFKWGIIGCGNVTEVKSGPAYKNTTGFELVAVMRRDAEKAKDYAHRHGIKKYYTDANALINDPDINAIYIATPPDTHKYYALKVAQAMKICCVEKPMAPNYNDSLAIYNAFNKTNTPLFVAYYRRSLPRFIKIKQWLDANYIGSIRHLQWDFTRYASPTDMSGTYNWRTDAKIAHGGYFDDLGSHGLDLFTFLLGNIAQAQGVSLNQQQLYSAKDAISACWVHDSGITGSAFWNFGCHSSTDQVIIYGNKGLIKFSVFQENPIVLQSETKTDTLSIENPKHVQTYHVKGMRDMLLSKSIHPSLGKSALHTSWVMDKILGCI